MLEATWQLSERELPACFRDGHVRPLMQNSPRTPSELVLEDAWQWSYAHNFPQIPHHADGLPAETPPHLCEPWTIDPFNSTAMRSALPQVPQTSQRFHDQVMPPTFLPRAQLLPRRRRKALLIGINYFSQRGQLRGGCTDVKNMSQYLSRCYGYSREDFVILSDDQYQLASQPTKENILKAVHWLVKGSGKDDLLFLHYSGHLRELAAGGRKNIKAQEAEDEVQMLIYPVDFRAQGSIAVQDIMRIVHERAAPGVKLTTIFDSNAKSS